MAHKALPASARRASAREAAKMNTTRTADVSSLRSAVTSCRHSRHLDLRTGPALPVPQPYAFASFTAGCRVVPWAGRKAPSFRGAVYLAAADVADETFDATIARVHPMLRRSGARVPYRRDLPVNALVGVARVIDVITSPRSARASDPWYAGSGIALVLDAVQPLPFAVDLGGEFDAFRVPSASIFEAHAEEATFDCIAWRVLEVAPRDVAAAAAELRAVGFDPAASFALASEVVPRLAEHDADEAREELRVAAARLLPRTARRSLIVDAGDDELTRFATRFALGAA
jgi:hypothetical protein